jgi:hypothetical protein
VILFVTHAEAVIPAKAGVQLRLQIAPVVRSLSWIPAFAGMTGDVR